MPSIFEKFVERVAGSLLAIIATIYISGFVIVNAYLSRFHIAQIEIFQPAFISAGLFFSLIVAFTAILVWPVARLITILISSFDSLVRSRQITNTGANAIRWSGIDLLRDLGLVAIIALFVYVGYSVEIAIGTYLVIQIIAWASVQSINPSLVNLLMNISRLQGLAAIPTMLLIQNWKRLGKPVRDWTITLSVMLFLSVHSYTLLLIARDGYEVLPNNIGGGQPGYVRFYVTPENARRLASLDNTFENQAAIIPENYDENDDIIMTNKLTLFWQIKSVSLRGDDGEEVYFVRPSACDSCPIIKIYGSSVYAVAYDNPSNP